MEAFAEMAEPTAPTSVVKPSISTVEVPAHEEERALPWLWVLLLRRRKCQLLISPTKAMEPPEPIPSNLVQWVPISTLLSIA